MPISTPEVTMRRLARRCVALMVMAGRVEPGEAQSAAAVVDSEMTQWRATDSPGCTVGLDSAGVRTARAYGMANLEYGVALRPESVIESGSVAKQFTAAAIVLLAQRGKLSLDDDVRRHLPEVPNFGSTITIRHLLHHTSGLRDQWALLALQGFPPGQEVHTLDRILDLVVHQRQLNFTPGAEFLYSNTGWALMAIIVQRVAGKPLAQFSDEEFFRPLGMTRTEWRADYRKVVADRATAYSRAGSRWRQDMPFTMVHGNGGLLTTVEDLLRWNAALTNHTIPGGQALVDALEAPGRLNDGSAIRYALGLEVGKFRGVRMVSHGGATAGYRTFLARVPERGLSVAVLCNAASANPGEHAERILARLMGVPSAEPPPGAAMALSADTLAGLARTYRDTTTDQFLTFRVVTGQLTVTGGGPTAVLTHLGGLRFWHDRAGEFRFERGTTGGWELPRFEEAWRRYLPSSSADTSGMEGLEGNYRSAELEVTYRVLRENGTLVLRARPDTRLVLRPVYRDGFTTSGWTVRFQRDGRGAVTGLRVFAGRARDVRFERLTPPATRDR